MELTQERVRELFDYTDGNLIAKARTKGRKLGRPVGCKSRGYLFAMIDGKLYGVHRLVFLYHHGHIPEEVDHIDLDGCNNRIENLRAATSADNKRNRGLNKNNTSGYKGVTWCKARQMWEAQIMVNYKRKHIGYYDAIEDAAAAYKRSAEHYFGEFARAA